MKRKRRKPKRYGEPNKLLHWIILPDIHASVAGDHDTESLATVERFMTSRRFDGLLNLGALFDFGIISSHNTGKLREIEGGRIMQEYQVANEVLSCHESIIRS